MTHYRAGEGNQAFPTSPPDLGSVTLVAVTSVAIDATVAALKASMAQAHFARVLLLSDRMPGQRDLAIEWRQIGHLGSRRDYSRFVLEELGDHITTSHALCVQWDGFVLCGEAWEASFLDYDYIGAPWPHFRDAHNVGNGGFSLRSRRLLEAYKEMPSDRSQLEDILICREWRPQLEQRGIRFAPESVARRFSYERTAPTGHEFGFHGAFNLVRLLPAADSLRLFRSLEPGLLARSERWQMFRWALRQGRLSLALEMLRRLA